MIDDAISSETPRKTEWLLASLKPFVPAKLLRDPSIKQAIQDAVETVRDDDTTWVSVGQNIDLAINTQAHGGLEYEIYPVVNGNTKTNSTLAMGGQSFAEKTMEMEDTYAPTM